VPPGGSQDEKNAYYEHKRIGIKGKMDSGQDQLGNLLLF